MPQNPPVPYAVSGPYVTQLPPQQESQFQTWVKQNKIPWQDSPTADYDMRGFYKAMVSGDPNAKRAANLHFPDTYKTPYHKTFSNESKYATKDAPHWEGDRLVTKDGRILADESPNPAASAVVSAPPGPPAPETQSPDVQTQIPEQPAQTMNPAAQGMGGTPAPTPTPTPNQAQLAKQVKTGLGWHALMGTHTEYQQGPNGPVAVPIQNKPGQLFRSILAGAIMGMGAGGENTGGSGWGAIGAGARAAHQNFEQQQQQQQKQAQQQWENQRQAQQDQRETAEFNKKQQLYDAQLALSNLQQLNMHKMMQQQDYSFHQDMAKADEARYSSYQDSGLKPVFSELSETEMADLQKKNPNYTKYDWVNTGVKKMVDSNGQPYFESTYSAYDPRDATKGITVSQGTIDQWKKDGLFQYHPEYEKTIKPGKPLSFEAFNSLNTQARKLYADDKQRKLDDLGAKKIQSEIDKDNAEKSRYLLESTHIRQQMKDEAVGKTQAAQFDKALAELNTVGGDFDKLKPSSRVVLSESMNKMVPALTQEYKDILASNDPDSQQKAGDVLTQIQTLTSLGTRALKGMTSPTSAGNVDPIQATVDALKGKTPQEVKAALDDPNNKVPDAVKADVYKRLKMEPPSILNSQGKAVVHAIQTIAPIVQSAL